MVDSDLYGDDGERINIKARSGLYNTETRQLTLEGNVRVNRAGTNQQLFTELLYYYNKTGTINSPVATRIIADQIEIKGSSLDYDVATSKYKIGGRVFGTITDFNNP